MGRNLRIPPSVKPGIPKLGVKPRGWREVAFKDILEVVVRPAEVKPNQRYQLINAKRNRGGIVPRASLLGRQIKTATQFFVAANDFVISRRQIVHGACGIVPPELDGALVSNEYSTLVPKDGLLLPYLGYYAHTIHFQQTCFNSSVGVAIEKMVFNLAHWLRHRLHLPPIEYQREVVDVLATMDRTIAGVEKLIAAKRTLKKGLAQQLLTGQRRLPGFSKQWKHLPLRKICTIIYGQSQSGIIKDGGRFPIFGTGGIVGTSDKWLHEGPAIILGRKGSIDRPFLVSHPFWAIDTAFYAVSNGETSVEWLYQAFLRINWRRYNEASGVPSLSRETVYGIHLDHPTIDEQKRIAAVLGAADREIVLLEKKLVAMRELKKGLMQRLLSGRVNMKVQVSHEL